MKKGFLLFLAVILMSGCTTRLTNAGSKVRIVETEPQGCRYLSEVYGSGNKSFKASSNLVYARNSIRNQAAALGADIVVIQTSAMNGIEAVLSGTAYSCQGK